MQRTLELEAAHQPPTAFPSTIHALPPDPFMCPITHEMMHEPVVLVETGHSFERQAIITWLQTNNVHPLTGAPLRNKATVPNFSLKAIIELWGASGVASRLGATAGAASRQDAPPGMAGPHVFTGLFGPGRVLDGHRRDFAFDDAMAANGGMRPITAIHVRKGNWIDHIRVFYGGIGAPTHGGYGGGPVDVLTLEDGEHITAAKVTTVHWGVTRLLLTTSSGRQVTLGGWQEDPEIHDATPSEDREQLEQQQQQRLEQQQQEQQQQEQQQPQQELEQQQHEQLELEQQQLEQQEQQQQQQQPSTRRLAYISGIADQYLEAIGFTWEV